MANEDPIEKAEPDWLSRAMRAGTQCRYYPNDERPPAKYLLKPRGHLMRHVLANGFKAWRYFEDGPTRGEEVPLSEVRALIDSTKLTRCETYKEAEFDVEGISEYCGLWILWRGPRDWTMRNHVQVLAPCHRLVAKLRDKEVEQRDLARATRKPKNPVRTMKTRTDTL